MSQISAIFGTDDDQEILTSLYLIANVCAMSPFVSVAFISDSSPLEHQWLRPDP